MNTIKDLLASVKCCISSEIYSKDLSVRYGGINKSIMYDAIINRILYFILSDIEFYNSDNIIGYYTNLEVVGINVDLADIIIDSTTMTIDVIDNNIKVFTYTRLNDYSFTFLDSDGDQYTAIFENNILTITGIRNGQEIKGTATKIKSCFDESNICEIYDFLNKKCKTC
jgi:hypothetical protein